MQRDGERERGEHPAQHVTHSRRAPAVVQRLCLARFGPSAYQLLYVVP
jgi:hypothetical protein